MAATAARRFNVYEFMRSHKAKVVLYAVVAIFALYGLYRAVGY